MRVFFITQRVPYPPDRGDKIATANQVRHLARAHELHVFCIADGQDDLLNVAPLRAIAASVTAVPLSPWRARLRAAWALVTGRSLSVAMLSGCAAPSRTRPPPRRRTSSSSTAPTSRSTRWPSPAYPAS